MEKKWCGFGKLKQEIRVELERQLIGEGCSLPAVLKWRAGTENVSRKNALIARGILLKLIARTAAGKEEGVEEILNYLDDAAKKPHHIPVWLKRKEEQ